MLIIYKFITIIIGCSTVHGESNLVNAFKEFLNVSLEWRVTRLGQSAVLQLFRIILIKGNRAKLNKKGKVE